MHICTKCKKYKADCYFPKTNNLFSICFECKYKLEKTEVLKIIAIVSEQTIRSKKAGLKATFTFEQWCFAKKHFGHVCCYCGGIPLELCQDHFIPVIKGGKYIKNNIVPACEFCNQSKHHEDFFTWYPRQRFYNKEREAKILKYLKKNVNNNNPYV